MKQYFLALNSEIWIGDYLSLYEISCLRVWLYSSIGTESLPSTPVLRKLLDYLQALQPVSSPTAKICLDGPTTSSTTVPQSRLRRSKETPTKRDSLSRSRLLLKQRVIDARASLSKSSEITSTAPGNRRCTYHSASYPR